MLTSHLRVADVMTIDPVVIGVDSTIEDATRLLHAYSITGLPVIDANGSLVGVISQTDLVSAGNGSIGRAIRAQAAGVRVGELMTSPAVVIPMTESLDEAARVMRDSRVHRLVVLDQDSRPIGVLSAMDFVGLFADA